MRYDAHTYSAQGVSADLEQQRRERTWQERYAPTADDWLQWCLGTVAIITGIGVLYLTIGVIETAFRLWFGEG